MRRRIKCPGTLCAIMHSETKEFMGFAVRLNPESGLVMVINDNNNSMVFEVGEVIRTVESDRDIQCPEEWA